MNITNTSEKIIHIGNVTILPDETISADDSVKKHPAVAMLVERGALSFAAPASAAKKKGAKAKGGKGTEDPSSASDAAGGTGDNNGTGNTDGTE